jgi:ketosteroid isomerase-like protein
MKLCAFVATVLMAALVIPAQAQDASKAGEDIGNKWAAAYNAGDAAGIAALFTPDGVFIPASGVILKGREAIEKALAGRIKAGWTRETVTNVEGGAAGNAAWAIGDYTLFGSGENEGKQIGPGKFGETIVRDNDNWHIVSLVAFIPPKP